MQVYTLQNKATGELVTSFNPEFDADVYDCVKPCRALTGIRAGKVDYLRFDEAVDPATHEVLVTVRFKGSNTTGAVWASEALVNADRYEVVDTFEPGDEPQPYVQPADGEPDPDEPEPTPAALSADDDADLDDEV